MISPKNINKLKKISTENKDLLNKLFDGKYDLVEKLIPSPEPHSVKQIFGEIFNLSMLGAIPVIGGISGGIIADKINSENIKEKIPDKIKEGFYQFFANIFLCNVGAGLALGGLEAISKIPDLLKNKFHINNDSINVLKMANTRLARAVGMIGGIALVGVIGGSNIANFIGKQIINPLLGIKKENKNDERKPELMDIALHSDNVATVGVLSGFKWIEPLLAVLYTISGYKAGIGYRNNNKISSSTDSTKHLSNLSKFGARNPELNSLISQRFKNI
ncbi:MAG: hypothetical protein WCK67_09045 [bacterium]